MDIKKSLPPLVVMGVSGCGKSTVGAMLGDRLGITFADGDDYHPQANKLKMARGIPLSDEDRGPWLTEIGGILANASLRDGIGIVACSALRRRYRDVLRHQAPGVVFVYLRGDASTIMTRVEGRTHEYMPSSLLQSQFELLEAPGSDEAHIAADIRYDPEDLVSNIIDQLENNMQQAALP